MKYPIYVVDAFVGSDLFTGNPAAICPLSQWLDKPLMQKIAAQNNLSETAFFVPTDKEGTFELKWFTPAQEVDLCGHATLATAFVVLEHLYTMLTKVTFKTNSGDLTVSRDDLQFVMNFPAMPSTKIEVTNMMREVVNTEIMDAYDGQDLVLVLSDHQAVADVEINEHILSQIKLNRGLIVTAKGQGYDFVSRYFAPELDVREDPFTGSAQCQLAPIWANILNKTEFSVKQLSQRGGYAKVTLKKDRVELKGKGRQYLNGHIEIN